MALKLISIAANDDDVEARIYANDVRGGFSVFLRDADSENTIAQFHGFDTIEKAEHKARSLVLVDGGRVATFRL